MAVPRLPHVREHFMCTPHLHSLHHALTRALPASLPDVTRLSIVDSEGRRGLALSTRPSAFTDGSHLS
jgi:hypothetical protein